MGQDNGVRAGSRAAHEAPDGSSPKASIPDALSGKFSLGEVPEPLRNGRRELVMRWQARLLPAKVCEGGGWYSAHPTEKAWEVRHWMEHKRPPGYDWPSVADIGAPKTIERLEALLTQLLIRELRRYGFKRQAEKLQAQAMSAGTAETQSGSGCQPASAVRQGAPETPSHSTQGDSNV